MQRLQIDWRDATALMSCHQEAHARGMSAGTQAWAAFMAERMDFMSPLKRPQLPSNTRIRTLYAKHPDPVEFAQALAQAMGIEE